MEKDGVKKEEGVEEEEDEVNKQEGHFEFLLVKLLCINQDVSLDFEILLLSC